MINNKFVNRDLSEEMEGRWLDYFRTFSNVALSHACDNLGKNLPCPINGGNDGFYLFKDAAFTGGGGRWQEQHFKTGFSLIIWLTGWEYKDVAKDIESFLGDLSQKDKMVRTAKPVDIKPVVSEQYKQWILNSWEHSKPITKNTPAWVYLSKRGIEVGAMSKDIRFSQMSYIDDNKTKQGFHPCIVSKVCDNNGNFVQLHRTYLTESGFKLTKFGVAKKLTASLSSEAGRVIRLKALLDSDIELSVTEGIETGLSIITTTAMPTWAMVNVGNYGTFLPPKNIKTIHNWIDKDVSKAGEKQAQLFKARMNDLGVQVVNHIPPMAIPKGAKGVDWNDQLLNQPSAFFI